MLIWMIIESKRIAVYLRLSQEDYETGKLKEESNSISNQRKLLSYYVKRRKEFQACEISEYCDDGYTGTNFDRPGFQRMLKDAASRKIDTIIVKDYSRIGRNFIGVGRLLEEEFPQMEIRVISVNDGYDSNNIIDAATSINVPIKNLINDFYIKDLSRKVKSGIKTRQKKGECISANAIFGYKKNPSNIHQYVIDEETAPIVRKIFDLALDGNNSIQIANNLNQQKIKTPAWYKNKSDRRKYGIDDKTCWTSTKVMKIIRDQRYAGDMVGNVRVNTKIAKVSNKRVDREDWIIVENTHEAIVSKEIFREVNECVMPLVERKNVALGENRRSGFCYCPHCGRVLQKNNTTLHPYLYCAHGMYDSQCQDTKVMINDLYHILSDVIRAHIKMLVDVDAFILRNKCNTISKNRSDMSAADIDKKIEKLKQSTTGLYERYREGKIKKEEYLIHKKKVANSIDELVQNKMKILNGIGAKQEQLAWEDKLRQVIQSYKDKETYSESDFKNLIERVDFEGNGIKIKWQFMDNVEPVLRMMMFAEKQVM